MSRFQELAEKLPNFMDALSRCESLLMETRTERRALRGKILSKAPSGQGIYVLYEGGTAMYVGRSDDLTTRLLEHGQLSGDSETSNFAFNLAKEEYSGASALSRKDLQLVPEFQLLFSKAKERVRRMDARIVEVTDPIEQTVLEVYAHLELSTFNSFENH